MGRYVVRFIKEQKAISVTEGTSLLEAMRMAGLSVDAPCGGQGKCGKCLADVRTEVDNFMEEDCCTQGNHCKEGSSISGNGYTEENGWVTVKACCTKIRRNCLVRTHQESVNHKILTAGTGRKTEFAPVLKICEVTVPGCRSGERISDWERLCQALCKALGEKRDFQPDPELASGIGAFVKGTETSEVILVEDRILDMRKAEKRPVLMAAFDVGTTSVAGYLLDGRTGEQLAVTSRLNPQTAYGADVIMRANYALEHGGRELSACIRARLDRMLGTLCAMAGAEKEDVYQISVVGNTCMHHLFLGISPDSLVHAPYHPVIREGLLLKAAAYGLAAHPRARLTVLPVIAGFVGADTVGCLLATDMEQEEKMTLMIDIGTNGELVLGNRNRRIACSTAAGPAFEGAKISCGMRGAEGAIDHAKAENGKLRYSVIGGGKPAGICGSGLIDLVASLLEMGVIDESGRLQETKNTILVDGKPAYLLADPQHSRKGTAVYLTQKDIREVQLAKGAIAAGVYLLAQKMGIAVEEIEQVYIAGAFGNYMNPQSACRIGLIPEVLRDCIVPVGNAAGEGAKLALLSGKAYACAGRLAHETEFLELVSMPDFQERFVDELNFPERQGNVCGTGEE
ncbi:MAG: ASKHA domain-containing protein [Eubacteriales bacterium]|nr:ASKHA domain-containing protein [Eubacteriales bacterium]